MPNNTSWAAQRADERTHENSAESLEALRALNERAFNKLATRLRKSRVPATPAQLALLVMHAIDSQEAP